MNARFASITLILAAACGGPQTPMTPPVTPPPALPPSTTKPMAPPPVASYNCLQVISCAVECAETDEACQNACLAKGTPDAQQQAVELAMCLQQFSCADSTCATDKCGTKLSTCIGMSLPPSNGTPLNDPPPPGVVPAELVGHWSGARNGITEDLTFKADGTGVWFSSVGTQHYACTSFSRTVRTGTFVVDSKVITLHATKVEQNIHDCVGPDQVSALPPVTSKIEWMKSGNPDEILIIDAQCAAQYPEGRDCTMYASCPIGLYCTSRLKRQ